jgi:sortase A
MKLTRVGLSQALKILFVLGFTLSAVGFVRVGYFQAKAQLSQKLLESAWQQRLVNYKNNGHITNHKPWSWADTWPVLKLNFIRISKTQLVLKDTSGESLAFGPGLMTPNLLPGQLGNSFIAAHRDTHFKDIQQLKINDEIQVMSADNVSLSFIVDKILIVDSRLENPVTETHERRLTLVTCYPFEATQANTPYRYLVSAKNHQ